MSRDSAVKISSFQFDPVASTIAEFEAQYGHAFLLRAASDGQLNPTPDSNDRDVYKGTCRAPALTALLGAELGSPDDIFVYALGDLSAPAGVGRDPSNRVCIDDVSVSARHALVHRDPDGRIYITDNGSRNGTTVAGLAVELGVPTEVPFAKSIAFGSVAVMLMPAEQFAGLVSLLLGPT